MELYTARLHLKTYTVDDFPQFWRLRLAENVWEYSSYAPYADTREAFEDFARILEAYPYNPYRMGALWIEDAKVFVGEAGVLSYNQSANRCSIGFNILPEYWGNGYATEIACALLDYAFDILRVERVEALSVADNIAAHKVLTKAGFTLEGTLRHYVRIHQHYYDMHSYGILASDNRPFVGLPSDVLEDRGFS
jgi:ribosomal-protein-alanine N-acetyltransferase